MVSNIPQYISKALKKRIEAGNLRLLPKENSLIDFSSNDYLGLAQNKVLSQLIEKAYHSLSQIHFNGSTGSRLISGNSTYIESVEVFLASIFKAESALIFNSGYLANVGVLSSIPQKGDTVLYDELSHACIKDGVRLSFATRFAFKHNDLNDLERKLQTAQGEKYVVVESIYSMDGDAAPIFDLVNICEKYDAYLIVDEAHSTGIVGEQGSGLICKLGLEDRVFIRIHTFGKAIGAHGACVAASKLVKEFLVNFSRSFIYTTAMPLHEVATIKCAFEYLGLHQELQQQLASNISFFKSEIRKSDLEYKIIGSESAIQALLFSGNSEVKNMAQVLQNAGFDVKPILSPTVKAGQERLRICLHAYDKQKEIKELVEKIGDFLATNHTFSNDS
ncbi:MAG: aminotransferase class I/II-fold pyridoxal phosphate-dependent enzyme [Cytophagales bacterium]